MASKTDLINGTPRFVNIGVDSFAKDMDAFTTGAHVQWKPPANGDARLGRLLACMHADDVPGSLGGKIAAANKIALEKVVSAQPTLVDILPAREVLADMDENTYLHAGPPLNWDTMCGSMRGGMMGALIFEGRANSPEEAERLLKSGAIRFAPCHSRDAAGPMAGIISPSMPLMVMENKADGKRAYCSMNEGWGRTLRFGAYDEAVVKRLHWMKDTLAKGLRAVIGRMGGIDIKVLISQALQMGDECHNRDISATNLFFKLVTPQLLKCEQLSGQELTEIVDFLGQHEHFFLNLAMAASKVSLLSADNIPYSTLVTVMARNGYEVGIRVSGLGESWFTAKAEVADGLYFAGYSPADANPDIGDSAITETGGIGAFAMAAAPAIVQFVGGSTEDAFRYTKEMYRITIGRNNNYKIPNLGFAGTPTGIDIAKVLDANIMPVINTGIAHKEAGHGLVGAGVVPAPRQCFEKALAAFEERYAEDFSRFA